MVGGGEVCSLEAVVGDDQELECEHDESRGDAGGGHPI